MGKIAEGISARVNAIASGNPAPVAEAASAEPDAAPVEDPVGGPNTDVPAAPSSGVETAAPEPTHRSVLEEKLAAARAKRAAAEARREERVMRKTHTQSSIHKELQQAQKDLEETRGKYARMQQGNIKEVLTELGRDPQKTFREMQQEAVEAGTPEGMVRAMERRMLERVAELEEKVVKPLQAKIDELEGSAKSSHEAAVSARFQADFSRTMTDPEFNVLREAYDDSDVFQYADGFRKDPESFHRAARQFGIQLTNPRQGFTMREILSVLRAAQVAHDEARQARRDKLSGKSSGSGKPGSVNGTTTPRNAATTISTELASTRASGGRQRLSRAERVEAEIRRLEGL